MREKGEADWGLLQDVLDGVRAEPARVGLSFLALAVGILALTVLLAVLGGLRHRALHLVRDLGANVVAVLDAAGESSNRAGSLEERHADVFRSCLEKCVVTGVRRYRVSMPGEDQDVTVLATDQHLAGVRGWRVRSGRFLDARDVAAADRSAVISPALARAQGVGVGGQIALRGAVFDIVGVVDPGGDALENERADERLQAAGRVVFIPVTAPTGWESSTDPATHRLDALYVLVPQDRSLDSVVGRIARMVRSPDLGLADVSWVTPELLLSGIRRMQRAVLWAGGGIASLCLLLGAVTLASLMVANVRDRVPEIGLRRALGATRADIALLFIVESALVTLVAAAAGVLSGSALLVLVRSRADLALRLGGGELAATVAAAVLLAAASSWWPAGMAARISPAEALRNE
jgi:putative ABC transport system permease protein